MAKQIGKGVIILDDGDILTLESECLNGTSVSTVKYTFPITETDDELSVNDIVLFVEDEPPGEGDGTATNVVKIPPNGCI